MGVAGTRVVPNVFTTGVGVVGMGVAGRGAVVGVARGAGVAVGSEDSEHPTRTTAATIAAINPVFIISLILVKGITLENSITRDM